MADIEAGIDEELSESDEEEVTAQALLRALEAAWLDERFAPELLPHRQERLECMLGQLQHMERNIVKLPATDLRHYAHKMEINTINVNGDVCQVTAQALLRALEAAWLNERFAPELLPHRQERLECMLGQLQHMERNIVKLPATDLRHYAHKMEINRINVNGDVCQVTAQALLRALEAAWLDERFAPELLPHRQEQLECMLGQLQHMERNIVKLPATDLRHYAHKMEINRIKFVISSYLRTRLQKIEKYCITLVSEERQRAERGINYLTPAEYRYAQEYLLNYESHMKASCLDRMPGNMQSFDAGKMAAHPDLNSHVFVKARETVNAVVVLEGVTDDDDDILVNLEEGAQHIMQYKVIAELVKSGKVQLI